MSLTNPNKKLFPKFTKQDVLDYYLSVSKLMLPHLRDRPTAIQRFPDGVMKPGFFQQQISTDWIPTITVPRASGKTQEMLNCRNKKTLTYLVDQACLCFHTWQSKKGSLNKPDTLVFDLDAPKRHFKKVIDVAKELKTLCKEVNLHPNVLLTGKSGVHLIIPVRATQPFEKRRQLARELAEEIVDRLPKLATMEQRKEKRRGRVFIDIARNSLGQTTICPYSLRPTKTASIATPISWKELGKVAPDHYTLENIHSRI